MTRPAAIADTLLLTALLLLRSFAPAQSQAVLRADPSDPNRLDADYDGIACENNRVPRDLDPVERTMNEESAHDADLRAPRYTAGDTSADGEG